MIVSGGEHLSRRGGGGAPDHLGCRGAVISVRRTVGQTPLPSSYLPRTRVDEVPHRVQRSKLAHYKCPELWGWTHCRRNARGRCAPHLRDPMAGSDRRSLAVNQRSSHQPTRNIRGATMDDLFSLEGKTALVTRRGAHRAHDRRRFMRAEPRRSSRRATQRSVTRRPRALQVRRCMPFRRPRRHEMCAPRWSSACGGSSR